ncbi:MAG: hypothetical protein AB1633_09100, partial [Elusimicrobiota bacterium]
IPSPAYSEDFLMKIVGSRKESEITFHATAKNLKKGCEFNDTVNKFFKAKIYLPKGVYHYNSVKDANADWEKYLVKGIIERQKEIKNGRINV